jgi:hypothetical protein
MLLPHEANELRVLIATPLTFVLSPVGGEEIIRVSCSSLL